MRQLILLFLMPFVLIASDVTLDTSFSGDAMAITAFTGGQDRGVGAVVQSDGKVVVAGTSDYHGTGSKYAIARYDTNGSLDTSFSGDGKKELDLCGSNNRNQVHDIALQSDGKIIVAGYCLSSTQDFALVRFNTNGSVDTSFNSAYNGVAVTNIEGADQLKAIAIQNDGKIVAAGTSGNGKFSLARYDSNGTLDNTFDSDGKVTLVVGDASSCGAFTGGSIEGVAIQSDGKIIVSGLVCYSGNWTVYAERFENNGSVDTSFITSPISGDGDLYVEDMAMQKDGKIVVVGYRYKSGSSNRMFVCRYNTNGMPDTTFDSDGKVETLIGSRSEAYGVSIQSDGKIVVFGQSANGVTGDDFALVRYNKDGSLDTTFDDDGIVTTQVNSGTAEMDRCYGGVLSPSNNAIFAVGHWENNGMTTIKYNNVIGGFNPSLMMYLLN